MNELAVSNQLNLQDLGNILSKSGYFQDTRDAAQAIVKVLAGQELGFGPIASMTGVFIIQNRISLSANMIAASIKRTKRYNYRVIDLTDERCEIAFFENGQECGRSLFTKQDAVRAGTKNMDKFPRNMLFARAISNGAKWYCADIFGGPVYTPEELGANVNEEGEVIDLPATPVNPEPTLPTNGKPKTEKPWTMPDFPGDLPEMSYEKACEFKAKNGIPYADIDSAELVFHAGSLLKKDWRNDEDAQLKLSAIRAHLTARAIPAA